MTNILDICGTKDGGVGGDISRGEGEERREKRWVATNACMGGWALVTIS